MNPLSNELARRADELLGDGQWHDLESVMLQLMKLVPPGRAMRVNERERKSSTGAHYPPGTPVPERRVPRSREQLITSGARTLVRDFLSNPKVFEVDRPGHHGNHQASLGRRIRMIGTLRAVRADTLRDSLARTQLRAEHLQARLEAEHERVAQLRKYLVEIGHEEAANRLAPDGDE
jgi:hypothetical protein